VIPNQPEPAHRSPSRTPPLRLHSGPSPPSPPATSPAARRGRGPPLLVDLLFIYCFSLALMDFALRGMCYPGCVAAVAVVVVSTILVCVNTLPPSPSALDLVTLPHPFRPLRYRDLPLPVPSASHSASTSSARPSHLQIWAPIELLDFRHRLHEFVIPWDSTMSSSFYHRRWLSEHLLVARRVPFNGSIDPPTTNALSGFSTRL
jgi:hypothetical protein